MQSYIYYLKSFRYVKLFKKCFKVCWNHHCWIFKINSLFKNCWSFNAVCICFFNYCTVKSCLYFNAVFCDNNRLVVWCPFYAVSFTLSKCSKARKLCFLFFENNYSWRCCLGRYAACCCVVNNYCLCTFYVCLCKFLLFACYAAYCCVFAYIKGKCIVFAYKAVVKSVQL